MDETAYEVNFDGLPGPTHSYCGLAYGNIPSMEHKDLVSNPRDAALQSLQKMKFLGDAGIIQGVFPPHERPYLPALRALGFYGSDSEVIASASRRAPQLLLLCSSSSSMWAANAATATPSVDSEDERVHFTPANLVSGFHRAIEAPFNGELLKRIFSDPLYFRHHPTLVPCPYFSDEGAANQTRFCSRYGSSGVHFFVYGRYADQINALAPEKFPARQSAEASQALARSHRIYVDRTFFAQQNPTAIDKGVFHNDVAAVGNQNLFFYHEQAYVNTADTVAKLSEKVSDVCETELTLIPVAADNVTLEEAVKSYLFNSQIITDQHKAMFMIAPSECQELPRVHRFLEGIVADNGNPIKEVHYLNMRESMQNGGGPACLRLRVVLTEKEIAAMHQHVLLSDKLYVKLINWVQKHYRDRLITKDLADPQLYEEAKTALQELTQILKLGSIYSFQRG